MIMRGFLPGLSAMIEEKRRLVAYHEAGHAVVARKLGIAIVYIRITRDNSGDYGGRVEPSKMTWETAQASGNSAILAYLYADLMTALAGPTAEQLAGYPDDREDFCEPDLDHAHNNGALMARIEAGLPIIPDEPQVLEPGHPLHSALRAIVKNAEAEVDALLRKHWRAVVRVAGVLCNRDRLTQTELDHIIAMGPVISLADRAAASPTAIARQRRAQSH